MIYLMWLFLCLCCLPIEPIPCKVEDRLWALLEVCEQDIFPPLMASMPSHQRLSLAKHQGVCKVAPPFLLNREESQGWFLSQILDVAQTEWQAAWRVRQIVVPVSPQLTLALATNSAAALIAVPRARALALMDACQQTLNVAMMVNTARRTTVATLFRESHYAALGTLLVLYC